MPTAFDDLTAWLRLLETPGIGNATARQLLAAWGPPQAIWAKTPEEWAQAVGPRVARAMAQMPAHVPDLCARTWAWWQADAAHRCVLTLADAHYPRALLETPDPPCVLYAVGQVALLADLDRRSCLAVVGSRNPTPQGARNAHDFCRDLAARGVCIVSGLALGIDGAAHEGALLGAAQWAATQRGDVPGGVVPAGAAQGLATVAVVGTGLDRVYPAQHRDLAHRIAQQGLLLSEYPLGTAPLGAHFPRRNRIISGLSQATLVVEAALESGSLITARQALEQGRDVLAIPGSIHSAQSKGSHALIQQGAKLVQSVPDVLEELRWPIGGLAVDGGAGLAAGAAPHAPHTRMALGEAGVLLARMGHEPIGLDALQAMGLGDAAQLQAGLLELELLGHVQSMPGGLFQQVVG